MDDKAVAITNRWPEQVAYRCHVSTPIKFKQNLVDFMVSHGIEFTDRGDEKKAAMFTIGSDDAHVLLALMPYDDWTKGTLILNKKGNHSVMRRLGYYDLVTL